MDTITSRNENKNKSKIKNRNAGKSLIRTEPHPSAPTNLIKPDSTWKRRASTTAIARFMIFIVFFAGVMASSVWAIPAFARKYSQSCKTCHSPFPKLKPYGEEFAGDGFIIKDQDAPRSRIETGDRLLTLLRDFPIALKFEGFMLYNNSNTRRLDFTAPYLIKVLSGAEIAKNVSYYLYFFLSERGEIAGLEDAFVMFNDFFRTGIDLYVGQFQVSDPLFKRELRLPFEDYMIYRAAPGESRAKLTYDRGLMLTYGLPTGTDLTFEILNGTGIEEANVFRIFDDDKYKNFMIHLSQEIVPEARAGLFGYCGREMPVDGLGESLNKVWMLGADASFILPKLEFNLQWVERRDANPYFVGIEPEEKVRTRGGFAEVIFMPKGDDSRLYYAALFNLVESDQPDLRYTAATLHGGYLLRRNMRLMLEATWVFRGPDEKHLRLGAGLSTAF